MVGAPPGAPGTTRRHGWVRFQRKKASAALSQEQVPPYYTVCVDGKERSTERHRLLSLAQARKRPAAPLPPDAAPVAKRPAAPPPPSQRSPSIAPGQARTFNPFSSPCIAVSAGSRLAPAATKAHAKYRPFSYLHTSAKRAAPHQPLAQHSVASSMAGPAHTTASSFEKRFLLPDSEVPGLLGPGGKRLAELRQKVHPVVVHLAPKGPPVRALRLVGKREDVESAERLVRGTGVRMSDG